MVHMCVFIRVKDGQDCRTETLQGQTRSDRADSVSLHTHVSMHDILHAAHTHSSRYSLILSQR